MYDAFIIFSNLYFQDPILFNINKLFSKNSATYTTKNCFYNPKASSKAFGLQLLGYNNIFYINISIYFLSIPNNLLRFMRFNDYFNRLKYSCR